MPDRGTYRRKPTDRPATVLDRLLRLKSDVLGASGTAVRAPQVRRAMTRATYGLGAALAVVAALGVHALLNAVR